MYTTMKHLDDEHMRLYEWCGAGAGMATRIPEKSKRTHAWHASYAILALMTSLLALDGCDRKGPAEQASEQVDQAVLGAKGEAGAPQDAVTAKPGQANEAAPAQDNPSGQDSKKPDGPASGTPGQ